MKNRRGFILRKADEQANCVKNAFLVGDSLEWEKGELPVNSVLVHTIQL